MCRWVLQFVLCVLSGVGYARPWVVAHRGAHHDYGSRLPNGCRVLRGPQRHAFIENTLPSIRESFRRGADMVEIDVLVTKDERVVLMHDELLRCMTEADGVVADKSLAQIQALDLGHSQFFREGSYPFRGQGRGLAVTLREVVTQFPGRRFMLNPKAVDERLAPALRAELGGVRNLPGFAFWGEEIEYLRLKRQLPLFGPFIAIPRFAGRCYQELHGMLWTGSLPGSCRGLRVSLMLEQLSFMGLSVTEIGESLRQAGGGLWLFLPRSIRWPDPILHRTAEAVIVSNIDEWPVL